MQCPKCRYMMSDFDKECPRCHGKGIAQVSEVTQESPPVPSAQPPNVPSAIWVEDESSPHLPVQTVPPAIKVLNAGISCFTIIVAFFGCSFIFLFWVIVFAITFGLFGLPMDVVIWPILLATALSLIAIAKKFEPRGPSELR